jgi:hypothetical protein
MILAPGSTSWGIVTDITVRLPVMILPRGIATRSQAIAVEGENSTSRGDR